MKKLLIKAPVLLAVFAVSVLLFSGVFNSGKTVDTAELTESSLPVLYMENSGIMINPMHGYTVRMDETSIRESVTPVATTRELTVVVAQMNAQVQDISYTITSPDGQDTIEERKISMATPENGLLTMDFTIQEPLLMDQEYLLAFHVNLNDGRKVYYYTRLVQRSGMNTAQYVEFVRNFYEKCTNKSTATELATYLESKNGTDMVSLQDVDITATYSRVTWGSLAPKIARKGYPVIKEINETTCTMTNEYVISALDEENREEYYRVDEYYRMRYASSRVMLLNFERKTNLLMDLSLADISGSSLDLKMADKDTNIVTNEGENIAAFEINGELYTFNRTSCRLSRLYSQRTGDDIDIREIDSQHACKIIRVEDDGDVDFLVYGYFANDSHEGQNGVAIYHYNAQQNVTKEQLFIPCRVGYTYLKDDMEEFSYINGENILYLKMNSNLFKIDLNDQSTEVILSEISDDCFKASASSRTIAWMNEQAFSQSTALTVMDLDTGTTHGVSAPDGFYIRALGFLNEDLIYGLADQNEITRRTFAMKTIRIERFDGTVVKEYGKEGLWVKGVDVEPAYVELHRVRKNDKGIYKSTESDRIVNNTELAAAHVTVTVGSDPRLNERSWLTFETPVSGGTPIIMETKYSSDDSKRLEVEFGTYEPDDYLVYGHGALQHITKDPAEAVKLADDLMGTALNADQQYIFERANMKTRTKLRVEDIPEGILKIPTSATEIEDILGPKYHALDLSGCTMQQILYRVSEGYPVSAATEDGYVLIVGFDYYNIILYNKETKETYYSGNNDSTAMFEQAGNIFFSYIKAFDADRIDDTQPFESELPETTASGSALPETQEP